MSTTLTKSRKKVRRNKCHPNSEIAGPVSMYLAFTVSSLVGPLRSMITYFVYSLILASTTVQTINLHQLMVAGANESEIRKFASPYDFQCSSMGATPNFILKLKKQKAYQYITSTPNNDDKATNLRRDTCEGEFREFLSG